MKEVEYGKVSNVILLISADISEISYYGFTVIASNHEAEDCVGNFNDIEYCEYTITVETLMSELHWSLRISEKNYEKSTGTFKIKIR